MDAARLTLPELSRQGVHDALRALVEAGLVRRFQLGSMVRFEAQTGDNHHHVVCTSCGRLADVACQAGRSPCVSPADTHDFLVATVEVVYMGVCPECAERLDELVDHRPVVPAPRPASQEPAAHGSAETVAPPAQIHVVPTPPVPYGPGTAAPIASTAPPVDGPVIPQPRTGDDPPTPVLQNPAGRRPVTLIPTSWATRHHQPADKGDVVGAPDPSVSGSSAQPTERELPRRADHPTDAGVTTPQAHDDTTDGQPSTTYVTTPPNLSNILDSVDLQQSPLDLLATLSDLLTAVPHDADRQPRHGRSHARHAPRDGAATGGAPAQVATLALPEPAPPVRLDTVPAPARRDRAALRTGWSSPVARTLSYAPPSRPRKHRAPENILDGLGGDNVPDQPAAPQADPQPGPQDDVSPG